MIYQFLVTENYRYSGGIHIPIKYKKEIYWKKLIKGICKAEVTQLGKIQFPKIQRVKKKQVFVINSFLILIVHLGNDTLRNS